jgi:hypothetical protein
MAARGLHWPGIGDDAVLRAKKSSKQAVHATTDKSPAARRDALCLRAASAQIAWRWTGLPAGAACAAGM